MRKIILASSSPKRKELLNNVGLVFDVIPSNYEEDMTLDLAPSELAKFLSKRKGETIAKKIKNAIIISADTFISIDNEILGKPHTVEKAKYTLNLLSGKTHSVFTGFTIIDTKSGIVVSKTVETKITFKNLSDDAINNYIKNGNPLEYAGSYTIDDIKDKFIDRIEGDYNNVIGLPTSILIEVLEKEFDIYNGK